jgi:aquaporin Z
MGLANRAAAEFLGTFWLVFGGCGSAVLAATVPTVGIGWQGVSLAFGLTLLTMAYALGPISGCHLNPAVSIALAAGGWFRPQDVLAYIAAQVAGAVAGAGTVYLIASGRPGFVLGPGWPANGFAELSPAGYSFGAALATELVLSFFFVLVVTAVTANVGMAAVAPLAVGLALTLVHLIGIPVTNTSVNPARSTGPALIIGGAALRQLWMFWLAPIAGGVMAALVYRWLIEWRAAAGRTLRSAKAA